MTLNRINFGPEASAYIAETKALHRQAEAAMQAHIDAQDAKIKALVEALERIARLSLDKWVAEEAHAALAAAKETTA